LVKIRIDVGTPKFALLSANQLSAGDLVHFAGCYDDNPLIEENIRLVTSRGLFDLSGCYVQSNDDVNPSYRKLLPGTKITLEVTE
jgi:hypothetical protein